MSPTLAHYLALTGVLAAWIVAHAVILRGVLRVRGLDPSQRALALIPPATPVLAWRNGMRAAVVVWAALMVIYLALQVAARA